MPDRSPPDECANCGASIPPTARSCPECGADERTGWRETSAYDGADLPEEGYGDESSAGEKRGRRRRVNGIAWYWWAVGIAMAFLAILRVLRLI